MRVYQQQTAPLVDYYRGRGVLEEVVATGGIDEVTARIEEAIAR
jgi:adenylate kinase